MWVQLIQSSPSTSFYEQQRGARDLFYPGLPLLKHKIYEGSEGEKKRKNRKRTINKNRKSRREIHRGRPKTRRNTRMRRSRTRSSSSSLYLQDGLGGKLLPFSLVLTYDGGVVFPHPHGELALLVLQGLHVHLAVGVTHTKVPVQTQRH